MPVVAVVGAQWGDEGKGRVIDFLAQSADMVLRFQGGDNAGHTVINEHGTFKLHIVPSGIFNPNTTCLIGAGTVVNPANLIQELDALEAANVRTDNLYISERAHLILPFHPMLDGLEERDRRGASIGTTKRGIGPAYADKAARRGLRVGDLLRPAVLEERLEPLILRANRKLVDHEEAPLEFEVVLAQLHRWAERLGDKIIDTLPLTHHTIREGRTLLLEGQLGVMRDLDWGTYPYVTSSNPLVGGACAGAGIPPTAIDEVIGVVKCYGTAVGAGPFPGELRDEDGRRLREIGHEYGATTGRPRRCAWLDAVALKHAAMLSGFTSLVVTKLDVLDHFDEVKICVAYLIDGNVIHHVPDTPDLERATPVYETWPGWRTPTTGCRTWSQLPLNAQRFLERIAVFGEAPLKHVSVGAERDAIITL
ncbi:MAG: adenylosuccinate synthetase [Pseudomonadota bacterium]